MFSLFQPFSVTFGEKKKLQKVLPNRVKNISGEDILLEMSDYKKHLKTTVFNTKSILKKDKNHIAISRIFLGHESFRIATKSIYLRLFLTIYLSVASCESKFSKLKLIKSVL